MGAADLQQQGLPAQADHHAALALEGLRRLHRTAAGGAHEPLPTLPHDRGAFVDKAVGQLREAYEEKPDPSRLLAEPFTLRRVQLLHEVVAGRSLVKDTFRRNMERSLEPTGEMADGGRGRTSRLFRRRPTGR